MGTWVFAGLLALAVLGVLAAVLIKLKAGTAFGSASFDPWPGKKAPPNDLHHAGLVLGKCDDGSLALWCDEGHWLLVAPTGAGKSTGILIPSIKRWGGSCLAIDVKGELARACAPALAEKGVRCLRIDPFSLLDDDSNTTNVGLDPVALAAKAADPVAAFRKLAEVLIDPPTAQDAHWAESARLVTAGMVAAASVAKDARHKGLAGVAHLCEQGHKAVSALKMLEWPDSVEPLLARALRLLDESSPNQRGAILSTVGRQLGFLASREVVASLTGSWDPDELLDDDRPTVLFLVLPAQHVASHGRFLRTVTGTVVEAMLAKGTDTRRRLLLAIDEAAALGRLEAIEQGIGLFRGYGATFLLSFQDDSQMASVYGETAADTIRANCNSVYWSMRDLKTCERVSSMLGEKTVLATSRDVADVPLGGSGETGQREAGRRLFTPDELLALPRDFLLCFTQGNRPASLALMGHEDAFALEAAGGDA